MIKGLFRAILFIVLISNIYSQENYVYNTFVPPIDYKDADVRAEKILSSMTIEEKIQMIGGDNFFFIKGNEKYNIPQLYLSDATQGVHIRKNLDSQLDKSTAFPCPIALTATWNIELANKYARSIGEECRAGGIAVLLGPGMNIYRISQNGRNFEYFGEDPFLAARMIENYVIGIQNTGTITTLKHFLCNNTEYHRRNSNSIVDERTLREIYLPAFKAGIDAGAMAVMTSYNQLNGEWAGQSNYVISNLLKGDLGFKWLVMSDWWSTWDPLKTIKSGLDLEMPGVPTRPSSGTTLPDVYVKSNAAKLLEEGKISESDINRMIKNIIRTCITMGIYDRPVKDEKYLEKFPEHEEIALQTARESIVLLKNQNNILPLQKEKIKKILLTGEYVENLARGLGSAEVEGYNIVSMLNALKKEFGDQFQYEDNPSDDQIKNADVVLLSIGTSDREGTDRHFSLPKETEEKILRITDKNTNVIVIVNSGSGIQMTGWNDKVAAIIYGWYLGQNGNLALAEVLSGKTNPSGKLPITIEKKFEDSPGYPYLPEGVDVNTDRGSDMNMSKPIDKIEYKEGVFVGYRWYESKKIEPLYHFGFGLSYTTFEYSDVKLSKQVIGKGDKLMVEFAVKNSGKMPGAEITQLYIQGVESSVPRPVKELKGFKKVFLNPGESKMISIPLGEKDFAFWDTEKSDWKVEPGDFNILIGSASNDIRQVAKVTYK
jgi:beta-glucosidase